MTLVAIFVVVAPLLVLYTSGYRLTSELTIIKTGGVYVEVPRAGADFYLEEEYQGSGSLFARSFFGQNLLPGSYEVSIEEEGYHGWRKTMEVFPTRITLGRVLMLPLEPSAIEVSPFLTANGTPTTTPIGRNPRANPEYRSLRVLFGERLGTAAAAPGATTSINYKGSTTTVLSRGNIGLFKDVEGLHAWWLGEPDATPYFFCREETCAQEIFIAGDSDAIGHFDFFPDDNQFVIIEWPDGVFATELDTRQPQNIQPIYPARGVTFRVIDGVIYILDDDELFELEL